MVSRTGRAATSPGRLCRLGRERLDGFGPGDRDSLALPAYVCTEVITRGLLALQDTRTPLITNIGQLAGRVLALAIFIETIGVRAIPFALAATATIETLALGTMLMRWLNRRAAERREV